MNASYAFALASAGGAASTCLGDVTMSALAGRTDVPFKAGHFRF
jgi:hypothetical protein